MNAFIEPLAGVEPPFPPRDGCAVRPLVLASSFYPALEEAILNAEEHVHLGFRILDPDTYLRSDGAAAAGLKTWCDLLAHTARRGVTVRLLLADFEPTMARDLHAGSWRAHHCYTRAVRDDPAAAARLQLCVAQHEGELGAGWRQFLRFPLAIALRKVVATLEEPDHYPGLQPWARPGGWRHLPRLWPATYHQKFAVIDGRTAFVGGLDIDERRWDDRRHRRRVGDSWHDVSARLAGPVVADVARHFADCWGMETPRLHGRLRDWLGDAAVEAVFTPAPVPDAGPAPAGTASVQLLRTRSRRSAAPWAIGPRRGLNELERAHRRLIAQAERVLYIEAQFFRLRRVARWIAARARQRPELQVIMVLPNAPEEVAFDRDTRAPHRHGEWLQMRALRYLRRKLGRRLGLFSLSHQRAANADEAADFAETRGVGFGAGMIHVHSKMLIADDDLALISSANINGRSFRWDSELGFLWHEPGAVGAFRREAWGTLLGRSADFPNARALEEWREQAVANAAVAPEHRRGFIVPHQIARARAFARPSWFVPDDLV